MKSLLLDANIFLRFILNDISIQQKIAEKLLQEAKAKRVNLIVPQIIVFEIEFILTKYYLFSKIDVVDKLKSIIGTSFLEIENRDIFNIAINIYRDKNVSLVDSFLKAKSEVEGIEIFTFDKNLDKLK